MKRLRIEATTYLAAITVCELVRALAQRAAARLIPLPEWRPLFALVVGVPAVVALLHLVVLPVRRAALTDREERR